MTDSERVKGWFSALCAIPWMVTGSAYIEACVVRLIISRWPRPMLDDPKHLATAPLHLAFQVLLLSLGIVVPGMVVLTAWHWRRLVSDWRYRTRIVVFVAGLLAFGILARYDPGNVWYWFLD